MSKANKDNGRQAAKQACAGLYRDGMGPGALYMALTGPFPLDRDTEGGAWLRSVTDARLITLCNEVAKEARGLA